MQNNQQNRPQQPHRISLFSKIKTWCRENGISALIIAAIACIVAGVAAILIGGSVVGWDIAGYLTSPKGYLTIVLVVITLFGLVYGLIQRRKK